MSNFLTYKPRRPVVSVSSWQLTARFHRTSDCDVNLVATLNPRPDPDVHARVDLRWAWPCRNCRERLAVHNDRRRARSSGLSIPSSSAGPSASLPARAAANAEGEQVLPAAPNGISWAAFCGAAAVRHRVLAGLTVQCEMTAAASCMRACGFSTPPLGHLSAVFSSKAFVALRCVLPVPPHRA